MTIAICFKCGAAKFGAFIPCNQCGAAPCNEEDAALSMGMSDHYFDVDTLEQMSLMVRDGKPPQLNEETKARVVESLRSSGILDELKKLGGR
jgi:hypothetical protein